MPEPLIWVQDVCVIYLFCYNLHPVFQGISNLQIQNNVDVKLVSARLSDGFVFLYGLLLFVEVIFGILFARSLP